MPAIHWRTATTPAGPITGNARTPVAAPSWLDRALPHIMAGPVHGLEPCSGAPARLQMVCIPTASAMT